ncbi:HesA/MoeB/ThiF family protein [Halpernia frigidisoli]|uniref:Adenylyltransferase and sulfurtransferase n=1 Tax=Halpernia frigidisoli TaxID=1125876 RepID=A0A1I3D4J6_9FLAO|nr:HesA/MoeB/ThiF family protein [Halpernia frigidisoli]SFH81586.1 adenylyltransferase and sulfurtransferase [Halpernia frigidisoli]
MEKNRYLRQITLPQIGQKGQEKLTNASVLVVGAGGLGNAVLPYLASSGIGKIGIIDGDVVTNSNLHRQILFSEKDLNQSKSKTAAEKLQMQFPDILIKNYDDYLNVDNALQIFTEFDLIVDATDNINIRYLINDACILTKKPFVHASVYRFQFQIATFNVENSGNYRCLYPNPPQEVQSCAEAGVMPVTVAMAGIYQANEVFKYFLNIGKLLTDKMLLVNSLNNEQHLFNYKKKEAHYITEDFFVNEYSQKINKISFKEAKELNGTFLDVRNPEEKPKISLENYLQIPILNLEENLDKIPTENPLFIFCQSGKRSEVAAKILIEKNFNNIYCLMENAPEINDKENKTGLFAG